MARVGSPGLLFELVTRRFTVPRASSWVLMMLFRTFRNVARRVAPSVGSPNPIPVALTWSLKVTCQLICAPAGAALSRTRRTHAAHRETDRPEIDIDMKDYPRRTPPQSRRANILLGEGSRFLRFRLRELPPAV